MGVEPLLPGCGRLASGANDEHCVGEDIALLLAMLAGAQRIIMKHIARHFARESRACHRRFCCR